MSMGQALGGSLAMPRATAATMWRAWAVCLPGGPRTRTRTDSSAMLQEEAESGAGQSVPPERP